MKPDRKHILITSLSVNPNEINYYLNGKTVTASQAPLALLDLLPPEKLPGEIIVLTTRRVLEEQFDNFKRRVRVKCGNIFSGRGKKTGTIEVKELFIPDGKTTEELWQILHRILEIVPSNCRLSLDLTHSFRSYPFLFFTAALFLKALHGVELEAVYYGMAGVGETQPLVELSMILDMVEWFYATRTFQETGQAGRLTGLLSFFEKRPAELTGPACRPYSQVRRLRDAFESFSDAYTRGLPVELGIEAAKLLNKMEEQLPYHLREKVPLPEELFGKVKSFIVPFALHGFKGNDKTDLWLDKRELLRQALVIDTYLEKGYVNYVLGLIREWMVTAAIFHQWVLRGREKVPGRGWLLTREREKIERGLGKLRKILEKGGKGGFADLLTGGQRWLADCWQYVTEKRNDMYHHGFKENYTLLKVKGLQEIKVRWNEIKNSLGEQEKWNLQLAGEGNVLISPLGLSRGLLYSALCRIEPKKLLVISSKEAAGALDEITAKAGWQGETVVKFMHDPYNGFDEVKDMLNLLLPDILKSAWVIVNITGGTTAMQFVVQRLAVEAAVMGRSVRRFALVDRRSYQEQQEDPYVPGELIWLDDDNGNGDFE